MDELKLLTSLGMHLLLTGLPLAAAMAIAARAGVRRVPVLLAIGLAASGGLALLGFWVYYLSPLLGKSFSYFLLFGAILVLAETLWARRLDRALLRALGLPLALWGLGSLFLLFFGYLHGGWDTPLATGATRFTLGLASDNDIPLYFAEWFYAHGHAGTPPEFPGEWLSSDRPPLQVGYLLTQLPFGWGGAEFDYQVTGLVLQQLWIVGLWALLDAAGIRRTTRGLAMATVLVSDLAIVNGFFVWPKLLPAAMLLGAAALLLTPLWDEVRRHAWGAALFAALLALAVLGHGSNVFAAVGLLLVAAYRGLPSWRWVGVAALVGIVALAPWSAYQKYADPPGNRLIKWQIGGVVDVDPRGTVETLRTSYEEVGFGGAVHDKAQNLITVAGGGPAVTSAETALEALDRGDTSSALNSLRLILFTHLLPSLGLLLLAPVLTAIGWRRGRERPREWRLALACWAAFAIGVGVWSLLMFGDDTSRTVIHQGSYLLPILGFVAAVVGLRATFPRFATWWVGLSAVVMLAVYVPVLAPAEGTSYSVLAALLAALGLAGFLAVAWLDADVPE